MSYGRGVLESKNVKKKMREYVLQSGTVYESQK